MTGKSANPPSVEAPSLAAARGVKHAFFTREGGVSEGLYSSLNCGFGSNDDPARVAENRRRLDGMCQKAEVLVEESQSHEPDKYWSAPDFTVREEDVEVAFLREKRQRSRA